MLLFLLNFSLKKKKYFLDICLPVYLFPTLKQICLWQIHFDIWQNQYNIVKFKNKIKKKERK